MRAGFWWALYRLLESIAQLMAVPLLVISLLSFLGFELKATVIRDFLVANPSGWNDYVLVGAQHL
jgi:hypothetical protein